MDTPFRKALQAAVQRFKGNVARQTFDICSRCFLWSTLSVCWYQRIAHRSESVAIVSSNPLHSSPTSPASISVSSGGAPSGVSGVVSKLGAYSYVSTASQAVVGQVYRSVLFMEAFCKELMPYAMTMPNPSQPFCPRASSLPFSGIALDPSAVEGIPRSFTYRQRRKGPSASL